LRALVTGGAGFIGSHVVEALLARGDEVTVLDNLATGKRENLPDGAVLHEGDIRTDADAAFDAARPELCFHLAAQADVGTSVERPDYDAEVNVLGTLRVLEGAQRHGAQLVFSSTGGAIYGECERPAREDDPRRPLSPYGTSKLAGEEYLATWNRLHGTRHVALRFANVFGPRQLAKLEGGVVAIFMERLAAGTPVQIFGDGEQTRDFVFVGDVVAAVLAATGAAGGTFNVGTGAATSVNALFDACRRVAGSDAKAEHVPPRPGDLLRSVLDPGLGERELGWKAGVPLDDGLRITWEWATARPR
jgi:UDP-glucose 4-epimerase